MQPQAQTEKSKGEGTNKVKKRPTAARLLQKSPSERNPISHSLIPYPTILLVHCLPAATTNVYAKPK